MKNHMKFKSLLLALAFCLTLPLASFAKDGGKGKKFEDRKDKLVIHLEKKLSLLTAALSCVKTSSEKVAMKNCMLATRAYNKEHRGKHRGKHGGKHHSGSRGEGHGHDHGHGHGHGSGKTHAH